MKSCHALSSLNSKCEIIHVPIKAFLLHMNAAFTDCPELIECLQINYHYWKGEEKKERMEKTKTEREKQNKKRDVEKD